MVGCADLLGLAVSEFMAPGPPSGCQAVVQVVEVSERGQRPLVWLAVDVGEYTLGEVLQAPDGLKRRRGLSDRVGVGPGGRHEPSDKARFACLQLDARAPRSGSQPVSSMSRSKGTPASAAPLSANETRSTARASDLTATYWPASERHSCCIEAAASR
jgi:hypothetical protein